jgi:hypothetical protein
MKTLETRIGANAELWEELVRAYERKQYAWYSDDSSVIEADEASWKSHLASQVVFTADEVSAEFVIRHALAVKIMNERNRAKQA